MASNPARTVAARVPSGTSPANRRGRRTPDGCLVAVAPLAAELRRFMDSWTRAHPPTLAGGARPAVDGEVKMVSATTWLISESRVQAEGGGAILTASTIRNVLEQRVAFTEMRTADAIISALGRPELFHDGTLSIVPNPAASRQARASCCSGSSF